MDTGTNETKKNMINTLISSEQMTKVQNTYMNNIDFNNDGKLDILMYDTHNIYIKYAEQKTEQHAK